MRHSASNPIPTPLLLYGVLLFCLGMGTYLVGVLLVIPRYLLNFREILDPVAAWLVWYSGVPIMLGLSLGLFDLLVLFNQKNPTFLFASSRLAADA